VILLGPSHTQECSSPLYVCTRTNRVPAISSQRRQENEKLVMVELSLLCFAAILFLSPRFVCFASLSCTARFSATLVEHEGKDRFLLRVSIDSLATAVTTPSRQKKHGYKCVHSTILVILVVTLYLYMMNDCSFRFRVLSNLQVAAIHFQQYMTTCVHECEQATSKRTGRCLIGHWRYSIITCRHAILGFNRQNIPSRFGHCHHILTSATIHY
jgi:hypothetical protein